MSADNGGLVAKAILPFGVGGRRQVDMPQILSIGTDASLLWTRSCLLRDTGLGVRSALPEEMSTLLASTPYRVAIFGHSLTNAEAARLAALARAMQPSMRLLLLVSFEQRPVTVGALFDRTISSLEGPRLLVRSVRELLEESA